MKYYWLALTVTTIGVLMAGIDTRIVIIGIPQVAEQLNADPEQVIWITQSYVLASTVMLLLIGRLADIFGRTRIFTAGFAIFTIGSGLTSIRSRPNTGYHIPSLTGSRSRIFGYQQRSNRHRCHTQR